MYYVFKMCIFAMEIIRNNTVAAEKKEKGHKRLTIAELRNCKGFENYSDEKAEETISTLEKLSILFYELFMKQKQRVRKLISIKGGKSHAESKRDTDERKAA